MHINFLWRSGVHNINLISCKKNTIFHFFFKKTTGTLKLKSKSYVKIEIPILTKTFYMI